MSADNGRTVPPVRHTPVPVTLTSDLQAMNEIDAHYHDSSQIVYASSGVLAVHTGAARWIAPAHRALWIPAGVVHAHRAYGYTRLHLVAVHANADRLGLKQPGMFAVTSLLRELIIACANRGAEAVGSPRGRRLLDILVDEIRPALEQPVQVPAPRDPRLIELCAMLEADPSDSRTLEILGYEVGASSRTLTRLFREDLAMTFPQWRTQLRLYHAVRLLAEGYPVKRVARRCGFSSSSTFIEVFRRSLGYSPGAGRSGVA